MSEQVPPEKPKGMAIIPSPNIGTFRTSNSTCYVENGSFLLTFYDNRVATPTHAGEEVNARALYEVVKLELSPTALRDLRDHIASAVALHEKVFGPLMSTAEVEAKVQGLVKDQLHQSAQTLLKPPEGE